MYVAVYEIVIGAVLTVSKRYVHSVAVFFRRFFRINAKERTKLQAVQNVVGVGHELPNGREVSFADGNNFSVRVKRIVFAFRTVRNRYKHFVARNVFFGGNTKERAEFNVFKYVVGGFHQLFQCCEVSFFAVYRNDFAVCVKRIINVFRTVSKHDKHFVIRSNIVFGGNADKRAELYRFKHFVGFVH